MGAIFRGAIWPAAWGCGWGATSTSFYVGSATGDDLTPRIDEHQSGTIRGYTSSRLPVELVWSEHFDRVTDAIAVERQLKGWSRAKKAALIHGDWDRVSALARRRAGREKPSS
ncbi:GIY-YIG nuclease family protein [Methyloligella solikamskensis]|uniref:GIY-YIG nuclease family protein n=1 Tax=Methyloligella solikamskensis TaxID=1177756 RepID=A0ABW3J8B9_9HYPH